MPFHIAAMKALTTNGQPYLLNSLRFCSVMIAQQTKQVGAFTLTVWLSFEMFLNGVALFPEGALVLF